MVACNAGVRADLLLFVKTKPEAVDERRRRAAAEQYDVVQRVMILLLFVKRI